MYITPLQNLERCDSPSQNLTPIPPYASPYQHEYSLFQVQKDAVCSKQGG